MIDMDLIYLLSPLYALSFYNAIKISQLSNKMDNCLYCKKSKQIINTEVNKI
jgi:hypothetical protein